jgi:D-glycero-alpha-D-manno-heptose-7-phosphate kinase
VILSRAPTRITLGGGGTDLPSYYLKHGGFLMAGAINKYCSILANRRFYDSIRLSYSELEVRDSVEDIEHRIFRAALDLVGMGTGLELHSTADVPAGCGLGTSSSFTVALLNALHTQKRDYITHKQLAEEACHIEIDVLGEPIGKQDQYMAAFGGLTCLTFDTSGEVIVEPLRISDESMDQLESNLLLFFTGKERSAARILADQDARSARDDADMIDNLHRIKDIGQETRKHLENGHPEGLGELMHVHWETKKKRSDGISDPLVDECYEIARRNGAIGGKLVGAGGGGFLMLYCESNHKPRLIEAMVARGLRWERFRFDFDGAKIMVNA